ITWFYFAEKVSRYVPDAVSPPPRAMPPASLRVTRAFPNSRRSFRDARDGVGVDRSLWCGRECGRPTRTRDRNSSGVGNGAVLRLVLRESMILVMAGCHCRNRSMRDPGANGDEGGSTGCAAERMTASS